MEEWGQPAPVVPQYETLFHLLEESYSVTRITYPNVIVALDELRVSKQTPLQHGLQESQVDHVEQQHAQNGEVHDDGNLKINNVITDSFGSVIQM